MYAINKWLTDAVKASEGCSIGLCGGENDPICLEFAHKDPRTKLFTIGSLLASVSLIDLIREIRKCVVACSNCHKKSHRQEKGWRVGGRPTKGSHELRDSVYDMHDRGFTQGQIANTLNLSEQTVYRIVKRKARR